MARKLITLCFVALLVAVICFVYLPTQTFSGSTNISRFGINYIYHGMQNKPRHTSINPENYISMKNNKLVDIGVGWVRSAGYGDSTSLNWLRVEPNEGVFDFSLHDLRVNDLQEKGLTELGNVDFSSIPDYAQKKGTYFLEDKYLAYLHKIVERYDGDGIDDMPGLSNPILFWEIGNETLNRNMFLGTPKEYAHVLEISYNNIKVNNPKCQVLLGGWVVGANSIELFNKSLTGFKEMLDGGGGAYFDIMNFHNYTDNCDFSTYMHVKRFKEILYKHGFKKPFWLTETNTKLYKENKKGNILSHNLEQQSQDIIKRFVIAFDCGVDVVFWHGLDDNKEANPGVGFFDESGNPKPIFFNLQMLITKIGQFSKITRLESDDNDFLFKLEVNGKNIYVLWTENDNKNIDLKSVDKANKMILTKAITEKGQVDFEITTVLTNKILITKTPVIAEPAL